MTDTFKLPPEIMTEADLRRVVREAEELHGQTVATTIAGRLQASAPQPPARSSQLQAVATLNQALLADAKDEAAELFTLLRKLKADAPIVHLTFAASVDRPTTQTLVEWLRQQVSPSAVVTIGIQPDLIGGVYVRLKNSVRDYSVRRQLKDQHQSLVRMLEGL